MVPAAVTVTELNDVATPTLSCFVPTTADATVNGCVTVIVTVAGEDVPPALVAV